MLVEGFPLIKNNAQISWENILKSQSFRKDIN